LKHVSAAVADLIENHRFGRTFEPRDHFFKSLQGILVGVVVRHSYIADLLTAARLTDVRVIPSQLVSLRYLPYDLTQGRNPAPPGSYCERITLGGRFVRRGPKHRPTVAGPRSQLVTKCEHAA